MQKSHPYSKLSIIYDKLMSHVNYKIWAEYVISLFEYANIKAKTVIDISCGTGSLLTHFNNKKFNRWGCDLSFPMVVQAQAKLNQNIFLTNDVKNIALKSDKFDAVLFLYDSLNYLQDEKQLNNLFREVNRILVNGGIFIFDIITDLLCLTHYKNFEEQEYWEDIGYVRHSFYDEVNHRQHNDFRIKIGENFYFESHIQKVFSEEQISGAIKSNGFELTAQLDDFTFHHSDDDSERIHYVCLKKQ
jgi:ubiquinone/menaquinone biosynthesis C-methylase UbiE